MGPALPFSFTTPPAPFPEKVELPELLTNTVHSGKVTTGREIEKGLLFKGSLEKDT